jgi:hypothetical protein
MKINWSEPIGKGFSFGLKPRMWLQIFITDIIFASIALAYIYLNFSGISQIISAGVQGDPATLGSMLMHAAVIVLIAMPWFLLRLLLYSEITHQAFREKETISKSINYSLKKYPSMLAAMIVIVLISSLISMIPVAGIFLAVVVGWLFIFSCIIIITENRGFYQGLSGSYNTFRKYPLEVVLVWLITGIISALVFSVFMIPAAAIILFSVFQNGIRAAILNFGIVGSCVILFCLGDAVSVCFTAKSQVEYYRQLTGKKIFQ